MKIQSFSRDFVPILTHLIATNDFEFSVADKPIADSLMNGEGKEILHYVEYFATYPGGSTANRWWTRLHW